MKKIQPWLGFPAVFIAMSAVAGYELGDVNVAQNIRVDVLEGLQPSTGTTHPLCIPEGSLFNIQPLDDGDAITSSRPYSCNGYNAWNSAVSSDMISPAIKKLN